jgi:uncharacterized membrane protein (UPF0127 family)
VSNDPTSQTYAGPALPHATVLLTDAYGGRHAVDVEVAATPTTRERGLMWRTSLPDGTGMLFIFGRENIQSFWMRNTLIALDMLFIGKDKRVAGIVENAEPKTLISRGVPFPSLYVLEVPGGWTSRAGIRAGAQMELQGADGIPVKP